MYYRKKISINNQTSSDDVLNLPLKNSQVVIESMTNIKRRAIEHLSIMNPYNLSKEKIESLNKKDLGFGDMALARYERYLNSIKKQV